MAEFKQIISVAPMMDWTDRHCRYFHRLLSQHTWLYTEMVTTGALLHGDVARHLQFHESEHPIVLQLGGSDPRELALSAKLGKDWGYDEINLNCGCPSPRVQKGAFGACLMKSVNVVAECVQSMREVVDIPVTVKHRIGVDEFEGYAFVRDFVGGLAQAGVSLFIVHARKALLEGLSPKENRTIPPLSYETVYRLKQDFPTLKIILNGGVTQYEEIKTHLAHVDGVMLGRVAYQQPFILNQIDDLFYGDVCKIFDPTALIQALYDYCLAQIKLGVPLRAMVRHYLGAFDGKPGARAWRRLLSDSVELTKNDPALLWRAFECVKYNDNL